MKSVAFLFLAVLVSFSQVSLAEQLELPLEPRACISLQDAQSSLAKYMNPLVGTVPVDDFNWLKEDDVPLTARDVAHAVKSLEWDARGLVYQSSAVYDGYCAAGASCWGWYVVDCAGKIEARMDGEE
ncbi:hypothetical protein AZI85_02305 [Bdellovibrio bacteriovorus]|uniref:Uncharacterized protein n=1 Tax=Bdellovibrio bacteriovorus TaxID=959 RepID=A0A150WWE8_BDEBC|nr:hypothetical protein [Bdellovibrio bacteriovorus]KYG70783.1 hypothetical protein AZI85_02305 [Bdellovibrio bacteriovorus]